MCGGSANSSGCVINCHKREFQRMEEKMEEKDKEMEEKDEVIRRLTEALE